jgi:5'-deoxynucleotidase YfbR-like HD superfamily hydrolase
MLADTSLKDEFYQLWQEYEERKSLESKIAKDADNLDVDLEMVEQAAQGGILDKLWFEKRKDNVRSILFTETAKKMFDEIYAANPHDWHNVRGRNRHNSGDWKKK